MEQRKLSVFLTITTLLLDVNGYSNNPADSLEYLLQTTIKPSQKLEILLKITESKHNAGDHHCLIYAEDAVTLADSLKNKEKIADANYLSGLAWKLCGDNSTSIVKLYNAIEIYKELNLLNKYASTLREIGETYRANGNYPSSMYYLTKALEIQLERADTLELSKTYNRLAALNYEIFFNRDLYQGFIRSENPTKQEIFSIITSNQKLKQCFDSTMQFIAISNEYARRFNLSDIITSNKILLGAQYSAIFETAKADSILTEALELIEHEKNYKDMPLVYYNFARIRLNQKKFDGAIEYCKEALKIAQKNDTRIYTLLSAVLLSELYQKVNNPAEAIKYFKLAQDEITYFYKNDLDLRIITLQNKRELERQKSSLTLQATRIRLLTLLFGSIFILISIFFIIIYSKNTKLKKLNTELKEKNKTIAQQNSELTVLNSEKDKLFSIVAHDLKGPLGTFLSITDLIVEDLQKKKLDRIHLLSSNLQLAANHLYSLLENLLGWSVIQRNAIKFSPEQINLKNFVENSTVMCTDGAVKKGINVIYKIPPTLSAKADTHMLQTVIRNLISNAIKFTPENGQITVSASTKNENSVEICITDTGIGMNQEIIDGLFTLNGTICRTGTNREPSTGLGLILCKEFLEKMGGTISVESDEGKGSTFRISLPSC